MFCEISIIAHGPRESRDLNTFLKIRQKSWLCQMRQHGGEKKETPSSPTTHKADGGVKLKSLLNGRDTSKENKLCQ